MKDEVCIYLEVSDVAKILGVCEETIRRAIKSEEMRALRLTNNKKSRWRIHRAEVEAYLQNRFKKSEVHNDSKVIENKEVK